MVEDDETNPWRWIKTAIVGQPSEIVLTSQMGDIFVKGAAFLHDDGYWYMVGKPSKLLQRPVAWRYAMTSSKP